MRTGAAFLVLVVMVLLVLIGATKTLVTGELLTRRGESDRVRSMSIESALDAARDELDSSGAESFAALRLPIDEGSDQFIEITINDEKSHLVARWYQGEQVIEEMNRQIEASISESGE